MNIGRLCQKRFFVYCLSLLAGLWTIFLGKPVPAETILFKSGKTENFPVIEKTDTSIKVNVYGIPVTYYLDTIESIDSVAVQPASVKSPSRVSSASSEALQRLSVLFTKGNTQATMLNEAEKEEIETLLVHILPDERVIGTDKTWQVSYHDLNEPGDFFQVDLIKKGGNSFDDCYMWFHILYQNERDDTYGTENFEGYRGMGTKDAHYFIMVGNVEIRAVADAEEYKNDTKIKNILRAFPLQAIERL